MSNAQHESDGERSEWFSRRESVKSEHLGGALTSSRELSRNRRLEQLTVNKLRFSSLGLEGREKEMAALKEQLFQVAKEPAASTKSAVSKALVLLSGPSGVGKTAITNALKIVVKNMASDGVTIAGKFDFSLNGEPYSVIASAYGEFFQRFASGDQPKLCSLRTKILKQLDMAELRLLINIMPSLKQVIPDIDGSSEATKPDSDLVEPQDSSRTTGIEHKKILLYAFRKFVSVLCSSFRPLVVILDDMQCADAETLELMKEIMIDNSIHNIMVVGCYRSNEVDDKHKLSLTIEELRQLIEKEPELVVTEVAVLNLGLHSVSKVLMQLLNEDDDSERLDELATLCFRRTHGNCFHLLAFMRMLQTESLLDFNLVTLQWEWDIEQIELETAAASNVVDMIQRKMNASQGDMVGLLKIAACLGNEFKQNMLHLAWMKIFDTNQGGGTFDQLLDWAVREHFLEATSSASDAMMTYRFVHDKVQEAAMALVSEEQLEMFQYELGLLFVRDLGPKDLDECIFMVVNLLGKGTNMGKNTIDIAKLHLRAAEKAKEMSAFNAAAQYAARGTKMLPNNSWQAHYKITLDLFSVAAEVNAYIGNCEQSNEYCNCILGRNTDGRPVVDKLRAYYVLIDEKLNNGKPKDALVISLEVLSHLDCHFPKIAALQALHVTRFILKLKREKPPIAASDVASMTLMSDPTKIEALKILTRSLGCAYLAREMPLFLLLHQRVLDWTVQFGLCQYAPPVVSGLALLLTGLGEPQKGIHYDDLGLEMLHYLGDKPLLGAHAMYISCSFQSHMKPLRGFPAKHMDAYRLGMEVGDTHMASFNLLHSVLAQLLAGCSLKTIEEDCRIYIPQMKALKRVEVFWQLAMRRQLALNLIGSGEATNTSTLTGEAMNETEILKYLESAESSNIEQNLAWCKQYLYAYFGEYEDGAEHAVRTGDRVLKGAPGMPYATVDPFIRGLCLYAMARKRRRYKRHAARCRLALHSMMRKQRNPNLAHLAVLLNAEHESLLGRDHTTVSRLFEQSSVLAIRGGFKHDAALASERYADYLLEQRLVALKASRNRSPTTSDARLRIKELAIERIESALEWYNEWGALRKCHILRQKHAGVLMPRTPSQP